MRNLRFNHTCEHRFVFGQGEEPQVVNGDAFPVTDPVDVPDTEFRAQVWRIQRGAELSVHDREADKLGKLQDPDGIPLAITDGDLAELPAVAAPDPTDPQDRTPREEVERLAADAGHTLEGALTDHDKHREFAKRSGLEAGGPAAPAATPTVGRAPAPRPAPAQVGPRAAAAGRPTAPGTSAGPAGAPTAPSTATQAAPGGQSASPNAPQPSLQRGNVDLHGTITPAQPNQPLR